MTPYYDEDGITIFHADCREVLPQLPKVDLILTDPPYGIGTWSHTGGNSLTFGEVGDINNWDVAVEKDVLQAVVQAGKYAIVWGGNYYGHYLGRTRAPLVWDKGIRGMHFADGEMAWTNFDFGTLRILNFPLTDGDTKGQRVHPTQKPQGVMAWCLGLVPKVRTVLDPFMGSGTVLRVTKDAGLTGVGIEIEERYCEIAAKRLRQCI
jgi:DNA modification methylase